MHKSKSKETTRFSVLRLQVQRPSGISLKRLILLPICPNPGVANRAVQGCVAFSPVPGCCNCYGPGHVGALVFIELEGTGAWDPICWGPWSYAKVLFVRGVFCHNISMDYTQRSQILQPHRPLSLHWNCFVFGAGSFDCGTDHATVRSPHFLSSFYRRDARLAVAGQPQFFFVHCMIVYGTPFCLPRRLGSINIFARDDSHHHLQQLRSRSHIVSGFERVIYLDISIAKTLVRFRPVYACNDFLHGFLLRSGLPVIRPGFNTQSGIRDRRTILFRLNVTNNKLNHLAKVAGTFCNSMASMGIKRLHLPSSKVRLYTCYVCNSLDIGSSDENKRKIFQLE